MNMYTYVHVYSGAAVRLALKVCHVYIQVNIYVLICMFLRILTLAAGLLDPTSAVYKPEYAHICACLQFTRIHTLLLQCEGLSYTNINTSIQSEYVCTCIRLYMLLMQSVFLRRSD